MLMCLEFNCCFTEKPAENDGRSYDEMLQQLLLDDSAYIPENEV